MNVPTINFMTDASEIRGNYPIIEFDAYQAEIKAGVFEIELDDIIRRIDGIQNQLPGESLGSSTECPTRSWFTECFGPTSFDVNDVS